MKLDCELIEDLLPLYEEELCSPASRRAVEEHLRDCEACRRLTAPLPIEEPEVPPDADRAVKKSMKMVKHRWLASLLAAVLAVPLLLLGFNQYRGYGLCYTNLDDVVTAWRFLHALETEDWEKAARLHDYSGDYESIVEALSMDMADWGSGFVPFGLMGQPYMASGYLERNGILPRDIGELYGFLWNREGTAMVPLELWEQVIALDPEAAYQLGWQYWLGENLYGKISTPWGEFVVTEGRGYDTAYEYCTYFDLVPAAVYEEAKPELEEEARRLYDATHEDIGWVAELTEDEFTEEMIRRYTADLKSLEGTVTFDCTGWRSVGRSGPDSWHVFFSITISQNGKVLDAEIQIDVKNGKILVAGISHEPGAQWLDAIDRVLYPSAHPGY
mgnify:CR=1 FL=1